MKTFKNVMVAAKRVLVRCDFNVPIDSKGNILDDFRIKQTLPTIKYLIDSGSKIILMSHLGDPGGKVVPELKLTKVAQRLSDLLNFPVAKADDCVGPAIESEASVLKMGEILMLENLRFHEEETGPAGGHPDLEFARKLAFLADVYVNDAFGVCHRDNASVTGVPQFVDCCAGLLLEKEIETLNKIMKDPDKPMVAIIGGKKVETKSKFIDNISEVADFVIVSGLIAKEIAEKGVNFKYPEKIIIPNGDLAALDINEESIELFRSKIMTAATVLWNGPFGKFEDEKHSKGSLAIAKAIIESGAFSVVGGGETVEFLNKQGMIDKFNHVSTGGGAMLGYLSGEELPGLKAIAEGL